MKKCYTIAGLKSLPKYNLDLCQITLNGRQFPSSRKTIEALKKTTSINTKIIIHYDYIYIVSRYLMFKKEVKSAIINEVVSLLDYAASDPRVVGIVMHTDWPLRKEYFYTKYKQEFIDDKYQGKLWDDNVISDYIDKEDHLIYDSILAFADDLIKVLDSSPACKVYLENTTKVGPFNTGTVEWLKNLLLKNPWTTTVYGLCYDTEHHFAVDGATLSTDQLKKIKSEVDLIVHLNTIPSEVLPKSGKDRHSETTISECSQFNEDHYHNYTKVLDSLNIPWVREVKEDTMLRELNI